MNHYCASYFPARSLLKQSSDGGAWLVAYKEEQKKRFDAVLCPLSKKGYLEDSQKCKRNFNSRKPYSITKGRILDGMYLLRHMNANDPSDLAYINIIGENLSTSKTEDFVLFDNVVHIEAGENSLTLDTFKTFPVLCELELQLNGISSLSLTSSDFVQLDFLDLSFNSLTPAEVLQLGALLSLKCLHLTGNGLQSFPASLGSKQKSGSKTPKSGRRRRFQSLEVLYIDENDLEDISVFANLASLPKLRVLNLAKNKLQCVPQLRLMALNTKKTHVLPTAEAYMDADAHDAVTADGDLSKDIGTDSTAVAREAVNNIGDGDLQMAVHPSRETQNEDSPPEDLDKSAANQEMDGLENFQFADLEEDRDTASEFDSKEHVADEIAAAELSGSSVDMDFCLDELECPFPNLEKIDLTDNMIAEDQALLPLATWPSLVEVTIWKNPLVKSRKGLSPLLQYHLTNLCGIRINRKEPKKTSKPAVGTSIAPAARYNKVDDVVPPLRQKNMLLLEFEKYEEILGNLGNRSITRSPLPSISPSNEGVIRDSYSAPIRPSNELTVGSALHRPQSAAANFHGGNKLKGKINKTVDLDTSKDDVQSDDDRSGVFLTQVDANECESQSPATHDKDGLDPANSEAVDANTISYNKEERKCDTIEELLKIDESGDLCDMPPVENVHANIKALKLALNNPLVFNESSQKLVKEPTRPRPPQSHKTVSSRRTRQDKVFNALDNMRKQSNIVEESLDVVLKNYDQDKQIKRQFPNVKRLLKDVQSKYDQVRLTSLDSACNAHKLVQSSTGTPHDSRNFKGSALFLRRQNETTDNKVIANKDIDDVKVDSSYDVSRKLDKFKEIVNSRI